MAQEMKPHEKCFSLSAAAEVLGLSIDGIRRLVITGEIEAEWQPGGYDFFLIPRRALECYMNKEKANGKRSN